MQSQPSGYHPSATSLRPLGYHLSAMSSQPLGYCPSIERWVHTAHQLSHSSAYLQARSPAGDAPIIGGSLPLLVRASAPHIGLVGSLVIQLVMRLADLSFVPLVFSKFPIH